MREMEKGDTPQRWTWYKQGVLFYLAWYGMKCRGFWLSFFLGNFHSQQADTEIFQSRLEPRLTSAVFRSRHFARLLYWPPYLFVFSRA